MTPIVKGAIALLACLVPWQVMAQSCAPVRFVPCIILPPPEAQPPDCGALCERLKDQLDRECVGGADAPYADTVFLRRGITLAADQQVKTALALATLAETPDGAEPILTPYYGHEDPAIRYAAGLHMALNAVRAGQIADPRFDQAIEVMAQAEPVPFLRSDLDFMRALQAEARGDLAAAWELTHRASQTEPRFFNALALEIRLLLAQGVHLRGPASGGDAVCLAEYRAFLAALSGIADLEPCPRVAAHLEMYLSRGLRAPDAAPGMQAAQVYLAVLSRREDLAQRALQAFQTAPRPVCAGPVVRELQGLMTLFDAAQEASQ